MSKYTKQAQYGQNFKDTVMGEILKGELKVVEIAQIYKLSARTVYRWKKKSTSYVFHNGAVLMKSNEKKKKDRIQELEAKINSLQVALSDKVLENCALQAIINVTDREYGLDLKKKVVLFYLREQAALARKKNKSKYGDHLSYVWSY